jgi:hypothetical protein
MPRKKAKATESIEILEPRVVKLPGGGSVISALSEEDGTTVEPFCLCSDCPYRYEEKSDEPKCPGAQLMNTLCVIYGMTLANLECALRLKFDQKGESVDEQQEEEDVSTEDEGMFDDEEEKDMSEKEEDEDEVAEESEEEELADDDEDDEEEEADEDDEDDEEEEADEEDLDDLDEEDFDDLDFEDDE